MRSRRRIPELDALRGIAAVVVVVFHWSEVSPAWAAVRPGSSVALDVLKYTPLRVFTAGSEAVLLFFVLSGFVLALPFVEGRADSYRSFLVRRAFRIYPAAWVAVACSAIAVSVIGARFIVDATPMVNAGWAAPAGGPSALLDYVALLRDFNPGTFDPALWSLVDEMRISLVFPLLVAGALAIGAWRASAVAGAVGVLIALKAGPQLGTPYALTVEHAFCFVVGIALARHRPALRGRGLWVAAVALFTAPYWLIWLEPSVPAQRAIELVGPTLGAALILVLCRQGAARRLLSRRVSKFLGEISYSLYLWHFPILLALTRLFTGMPPTALAPAGIALAVGVSVLSRRWIEVPLTRVGGAIARRLEADRARPVLAAERI